MIQIFQTLIEIDERLQRCPLESEEYRILYQAWDLIVAELRKIDEWR